MFIFPTVACTFVAIHLGIRKRGSSYHFDPTNLSFLDFICFPHANIELLLLRQVNALALILANTQLMLTPGVCSSSSMRSKEEQHRQTSCPRRSLFSHCHLQLTIPCSDHPCTVIARQANSQSPSSWQLYRPNFQGGWYKYVRLSKKILKWIQQQCTAEVFTLPL